MSPVAKYYIGAGVASILALIVLPSLVAWLIVIGLLAAPVVVYLMLDESQRARLRRIRRRQLGR